MPVQGHLVGSRRFGDGFDPNCPDPVAIKQIGRDRENAFPRRNSISPSDSCGPSSSFHGSPLTRVLPVSTYVYVTGQYHKGDTKSTPPAAPDRRRIKHHETPSITLAASVARAPAVRSRRRTRRWIRSGGPADREHGRAAMAWSDGGSGNCPGEPTD